MRRRRRRTKRDRRGFALYVRSASYPCQSEDPAADAVKKQEA
jgi:hypothetical protein